MGAETFRQIIGMCIPLGAFLFLYTQISVGSKGEVICFWASVACSGTIIFKVLHG